VIFQDFPGPGIFKKKIQDFPGLSRRRGNPDCLSCDANDKTAFSQTRAEANGHVEAVDILSRGYN